MRTIAKRCPVGAAVALMGLAGCQSYAPRPLDEAASMSEFLERAPDSPRVEDFVRQLNQGSGKPRVFDAADGLDVWEAEAVALVYNSGLRRARLRAGVASAEAAEAGLWEDPELGVDLTRILESVENPWKIFSTVAFTLPISGRLELEKQRAGLEHAAELTRVWAAEWGVRMEVRRAWIEWSSAHERARVLGEFAERIDALVAIVDRVERAGEMSRVEARLFRIEQAGARTEAERFRREEEVRRLELKQLLGLSPSATVGLNPEGAWADADAESLRAASLERSPAIAVARAEYEVSERTLELEVRKQYPDLKIGPGYGREDGQDQFLLGLAVPLPVLNANRQAIARATAERELRRAEWEGEREGVIGGFETASKRLEVATAERRSLEEGLAPLADQQYSEARRLAELGEVNTLLMLESIKSQREAKRRVLDARAAERLAEIQVQEIAGPTEDRRENQTP
ncbi:MAG: TolC family protein [Phycisphaerales bacterium]|nr:TolC family protein [Phycisphaerales bacterium]